jgi:hypothetical protein
MRKLAFKKEIGGDEKERSADVTRIVNAFIIYGDVVSREDAKLAWEKYSDSMAAGWMGLPSEDNEIYHCVRSYFEECDW